MKKIFLILIAFAAFSCSSKSDEAQRTASDFLAAFLANDYYGAAGYCSEDFEVDFNKILEDFAKLDEPMKGILKEQCSLYQAEILSVEEVNESDTFKVNYQIVKIAPDTASFDSGVAAKNTLTIYDGKVVRLN